ncbi:MAG: hypothetical protein ACRDZR_09825 [Acidimicrobiales bacterium]
MSSGSARSTGPLVLALAAALTVVAAGAAAPAGASGGTGTSGGSADTTPGAAVPAAEAASAAGGTGAHRGTTSPPLTLAYQTPWVTPAPPGSAATFTLAVDVRQGVPADDEVVTTLYTKLTTRSGFEQTLTRAPTGRVLDRTHPVALSSLPADHGGGGLTISVLPGATTAPPPGGAPTLVLTCASSTPTRCTGVYPLEVSLVRPQAGGGTPAAVPRAHFTTYLTYATSASADKLGFAWVVPVAAPVAVHDAAHHPSRAVQPPTASQVTALSGLAASLSSHPDVAVTVAASPQTLQALSRPAHGTGAQGVQELAAASTGDPAQRQFLAQPYVPVDLGALAGAGEGEEITAQMREGGTVLQDLGVQAGPGSGTWVTNGPVGSDLQAGLSAKGLGATSLVLPDADLAPPAGSSGSRAASGTWASAFTLSLGGKGPPVTAAASDGELAAHFTADPSDPALEANQLLADLAMVHFEEPDTPTPRALVAVPPAGWTPTKAFDTALLTGLTTDPLVKTTTLAGYFAGFGSTAAQLTTRRLATGGTGPVLAPSLAHDITVQRLRLTAFDGSVDDRSVTTHLDQLLLTAESDDLSRTGQAAGVAAFAGALDGQLSLVQLATERTITLTSRSGYIPVTMVSSAPYTLVGTLTLSGGRFEFPHGSSQRLRLDHATTPVRVEVEARTSGDLPLDVTFTSPDGRLVITSGRLTVRSTATSLVGVVLTVLALLVLLGWWARTWHRGRRRTARGSPHPDA